jgi:hypothetical protein
MYEKVSSRAQELLKSTAYGKKDLVINLLS